ncbi:receptor-like serine/threonine-protein kinase SD1-8-like protein [Corchorus olitorius]|uniref:Receptor-like serine/threonine-protein kinase SD1-8-like protein n=1 Tax=Corchorus olitorius TaxID=93759 RepID=A0A1R3L330_9ROSI|nr:receptor-like serine/threonine-protein kinase SD1-8-like protein [Corchorus olitorius]
MISACAVVKLPPGRALGNTSTRIASGKMAIMYCFTPARLTYWVANLRPPSSRAQPTSPAALLKIATSASRLMPITGRSAVWPPKKLSTASARIGKISEYSLCRVFSCPAMRHPLRQKEQKQAIAA